MSDPRVEKLADMMVNYSVAVKPGDRVMLQSSTLAMPLTRAVYRKVLEAGGNPLVFLQDPGIEEIHYRHANDAQLQFIHQPIKYVFENYDVRIYLGGEENTRSLNSVDPQKMVLRSQAMREISEIFLKRAATKELRWTLTMFPTQASAQEADMSLAEYEDFVYSACMPDLDDPVGYWQGVSARQQKIVDWLSDKKEVRVTGPDTDLRLNIAGRTWINCDCHENVPDGEIFTGPVENSMQGHVHYTYPAIYGGREVSGVQLWFEDGKVVKACADKNEEFLIKTLDTDPGARYVGEFAIGTNEGINRFTREILFDEKIGGSFHMAVGAGYPETGSSNQSSVHWDMICDLRDGGEIWVDDTLLYKNGQFVLEL
jgi:aminopeptidase